MQSQNSLYAGSGGSHPFGLPVPTDLSITENPFAVPVANNTVTRHTVRHHITELQSAEAGRKYATVDRRPLDPPPVVSLQITDIYTAGPAMERMVSRVPTEEAASGIVCFAELFNATSSTAMTGQPSHQEESGARISKGAMDSTGSWSRTGQTTSYNYHAPASSDTSYDSFQPLHDFHDFQQYSEPEPVLSPSTSTYSPMAVSPQSSFESTPALSNQANVAQNLFGSTATDALVVDWQGQKQIMFTFGDLAVKSEGTFRLRYRVFDITQTLSQGTLSQGEGDGGMLAECVGSPFRIYSTRDFPGLSASTPLTLHLSLNGARVHTRASPGRGKARGEPDDEPREAIATSAGLRRRRLK